MKIKIIKVKPMVGLADTLEIEYQVLSNSFSCSGSFKIDLSDSKYLDANSFFKEIVEDALLHFKKRKRIKELADLAKSLEGQEVPEEWLLHAHLKS